MSYFKTFFLMLSLIVLFAFVGFFIGGEAGMIFALVFASIGNITAYWYSDKLILKIYSAKIIREVDYPELSKIVFELCSTTKVPKPAIYLVEEDAPNAFATGRNPDNAAIAAAAATARVSRFLETPSKRFPIAGRACLRNGVIVLMNSPNASWN